MYGRSAALAALILAIGAVAAQRQEPEHSPQESKWIIDLKGERTLLKTAEGKPFNAYFIGPKDAVRGILVIPESGRGESARPWAEAFAALGYRVAVVDLYGGRMHPQARGPARALDQNKANARYRATLEALREEGRKLAVIGSCHGGGQALEASLAAPDLVSATVVYFGSPAVDASRLTYMRAPVLVIQAKREGAERVEAFRQDMKEAGKVVETRMYDRRAPCGKGGEGSSETGEASWQMARDFLNQNLK